MISLKEAIKITKISDEEVCYIREENANRYDVEIVTLNDIKNKYDMKNTMVVSIRPRFSKFDYCGMEFEVKRH